MINDSISEWADGVIQSILGELYSGLYEKCNSLFGFLFYMLNERVNDAQTELTTPINTWNASAYNLIHDVVVEDVCIPIAAAFVTFIFCLELIHLMQDGNQMHNIKPQNVIFIFLKFAVCALICSKSFDIVMGFYDLGRMAVRNLGDHTATQMTNLMSLEDLLPETPDRYTFSLLLTLLGDFLLLLVSLVIVCVMSVIVYVRVMLWFLEFLIYASAAPIPFSTFNNKEWAQVGMNYTRKMLAVSFEGFFLLLMLVLYGYVVGGLTASDNFLKTLTMMLGVGVALIVLMQKAGTISASIFNAH